MSLQEDLRAAVRTFVGTLFQSLGKLPLEELLPPKNKPKARPKPRPDEPKVVIYEHTPNRFYMYLPGGGSFTATRRRDLVRRARLMGYEVV